MKISAVAPVLFTVLAGTALAQDKVLVIENHPTFAVADTDRDGRLSVAEMKVVFPDVTIVDLDADDYVSQVEAEAAIAGLSFTVGAGTALLTEPEYDLIVATLAADDPPPVIVHEDDDPDVEIEIENDGDVEIETDN